MSEVKVNKISPRTNCGTTTLGDSGDSFVIPSGVTITNNGTQTGFGRSGSVNWQTTPKTATFTAVNGEGYFINQGSAITANLPAGSAGAIVAFSDYARNFATHNFTISPNGSEKIGGIAEDLKLTVNGQALTLVYVDSTKGWVNVQNAQDTQTGTSFTVATGGTITTSGDFKIHTFTGPGTFCVSAVGAPTNTADYLVIAGGGGGGYCMGGGGGAGGYRESGGTASGCYTVSPLGSSPSPVAALTLAVQGYPITVGAGGGGGTSNNDRGCSGANSVFSTITSAGGGGGGARPTSSPNNTLGLAGGSGGGNSNDSPSGNVSPAGNTPPVTPPQGQPGGRGRGSYPNNYSGGGGGATGAGGTGGPGDVSGCGGAGATSSINATPTGRAGGGSGGIYAGGGHSKGTASDGGGVGGPGATNGTANTGGGAGGGGHSSDPGTQNGATGGSGIVVIRYKFQ